MKRILTSIVALSIGWSGVGSLQAQGPAIAYPGNNWSYINHSSTYTEGALRGQAAYLSAAGDLTYMGSLAEINYQEAFRRAIDNSVALTKAYYDRREIREQYMKKYGPKPFVGEARKRANESYQPKRLSAQEFDHQSGKLTWPHILRQELYAPIKDQVDQLFATRTEETSGDGSPSQRKIAQLCDALTILLRENIGTMAPDQYIAAREFVRSVEMESKSVVRSLPMIDEVVNEKEEGLDSSDVPADGTVGDPS